MNPSELWKSKIALLCIRKCQLLKELEAVEKQIQALDITSELIASLDNKPNKPE